MSEETRTGNPPLPFLLGRPQVSEEVTLLVTSSVVGVGAGLGAIALRWLISFFTRLSFSDLGGLLAPVLGRFHVILLPALGGLLVGPIVYFFAQEAKGHGVPEIMAAVALKGGRIRPRVALAKSVASGITIGSGGSAGAEGPIAQIGAAVGSTVGQLLKMSDERVANLAACGAAGGIAATFNAPIAGALFALELILGEFSAAYFGTVVISSVVASVVANSVLGSGPILKVPAYSLVSPFELLLYLLLGLVAAPASLVFVRLLYFLEDKFDDAKMPPYLKPALGGLGVGLIGLVLPASLGAGYGTMEQALASKLSLLLMVALLVGKIVATSLCLGSGGSGGIFAPSLYMGAMLGGTFGTLAHLLFPSLTAAPGAYAIVGMSAFFAGAARAPITSIIILFEMTGDYRIILPLMLATVVSTTLSQHLQRESIYTLKLARRGIRLRQGRDVDILQGITVAEVMTRNTDAARSDWPLARLEREFARTRHHGLPVLDEQRQLVGIVTLQDLERARAAEHPEQLTVADLATKDLVVAYPDEPVALPLRRMGARDLGRLPVVERANPRQLLGLLRRQDIIKAYDQALFSRRLVTSTADKLRLVQLPRTQLAEVEVAEGSPAAGNTVAKMGLPRDCVLVWIQHEGQTIMPHGDVVLHAGDQVAAMVRTEQVERFLALFRDARPAEPPQAEPPGASDNGARAKQSVTHGQGVN